MDKAEKYLKDRIIDLSDEKDKFYDMINEINFEVKETKSRIRELKSNIDDSFEIFSPRTKKYDFTKNEIESLENRIDELNSLKEEYQNKIDELSNDISEISDILNDETEETTIDTEEKITAENKNDAKLPIDKITENEQKFIYAKKLEENVLQPISNLIHKCEICNKVVEVDTGRAKLEIEVMSKSLSEIYEKIKDITTDLKRPFDLFEKDIEEKSYDNTTLHNNSSVNKIYVKKLSTENFSKEIIS